MMPKQLAQTSPGSVLSLRGSSIPGSPAAAIVARVEDGVIGYKDLAALPRDKAILDIERPDLMIYQPHYSYSPLERSLSPRSISPPPSPENLSKEWLENRSPGGSSPGSTVQTSRTHSAHTPPPPHTPNTPHTHSCGTKSSVQHFHRPENGTNIYKKPPIYKQDASSSVVPQGKHIEDLIIESSKFPAAQPPDPNLPSKIETDYWPCPPSLAVIEKEWRKKEQKDEDEEEDGELDDELWGLGALQKQELNKIQSNLGKIILKEELEKSAAPLRRKTRSLPDRSPNTGIHTHTHTHTHTVSAQVVNSDKVGVYLWLTSGPSLPWQSVLWTTPRSSLIPPCHQCEEVAAVVTPAGRDEYRQRFTGKMKLQ